jgi:hypothetical protein
MIKSAPDHASASAPATLSYADFVGSASESPLSGAGALRREQCRSSAAAPAPDVTATLNTLSPLVAGSTVPAGVKWNMDSSSAAQDAVALAQRSATALARSQGGQWPARRVMEA